MADFYVVMEQCNWEAVGLQITSTTRKRDRVTPFEVGDGERLARFSLRFRLGFGIIPRCVPDEMPAAAKRTSPLQAVLCFTESARDKFRYALAS